MVNAPFPSVPIFVRFMARRFKLESMNSSGTKSSLSAVPIGSELCQKSKSPKWFPSRSAMTILNERKEKMKASESHKLLHEISPRQVFALDVLDKGGTQSDAAEAAGVDRTTVSRWIHYHPAFIAEGNRRKILRSIESQRQVELISSLALDGVEKAITDGDTDACLRWLKLVGVDNLRQTNSGLDNATKVIESRRLLLKSAPTPVEALFPDSRKTEDAISKILEDLGDARE